MDYTMFGDLEALVKARAVDRRVYSAEGTGKGLIEDNEKRISCPKLAGNEELDSRHTDSLEQHEKLKKSNSDNAEVNALLAETLEANLYTQNSSREECLLADRKTKPFAELINNIRKDLSYVMLLSNSTQDNKTDLFENDNNLIANASLKKLKELASTTLSLYDNNYKVENEQPNKEHPKNNQKLPSLDIKIGLSLSMLSEKITNLENIIGIPSSLRAPGAKQHVQNISKTLDSVITMLSQRSPAVRSKNSSPLNLSFDNSKYTSETTIPSSIKEITTRIEKLECELPKVITRLRGLRKLDSDISYYSNILKLISQRQASMSSKISDTKALLDDAVSTHETNMSTVVKNIEHLIKEVELLKSNSSNEVSNAS